MSDTPLKTSTAKCPAREIRFNILGLRVVVRTDSAKLAEYIKRAYALFSNKPLGGLFPAGRCRAKDISASLMDIRSRGFKSAMSLEARLKKIILVNLEKKYFLLHASSIITKNRTLVFIGRSETGKSSLVSLLSGKGRAILSDDITILDHKAKTSLPFFTFSHIREKLITAFGENNTPLQKLLKKYKILRESTLYFMNDKEFSAYFKYHDNLYQNRLQENRKLPRRLSLIFLNKTNNDMPTLNALDIPASFEKLAAAAILPSGDTKAIIKKILHIISYADCYNLNLGDIKKTVELIEKYIIKNYQ